MTPHSLAWLISGIGVLLGLVILIQDYHRNRPPRRNYRKDDRIRRML